VPIVGVLLALSAWPNGISGHSFAGAFAESKQVQVGGP
jgi:hypothetical protein